jgi:nitroreductase
MKKIYSLLLTTILFFSNICLAAEENATLATIHSRKSVRHYIDKPVSKESLETLLRAGMAAPTAGDKRPWAFVAVNDKATLLALANEMPYGKMLMKAGAAIVVCGIPAKSFPGITQDFWIQDCSALTENILLAAESMGLGAVWLGVHPMPDRIDAVRRVLKIPAGTIPLCIVSIGYPVGDEKPKDKFDPSNIHWNKW